MSRIRRRNEDDTWDGARHREPWEGPSSQWGEDVNTRLGNIETELGMPNGERDPNRATLREQVDSIASVFQKFRKFGLAALAVLAFLGWQGITQVWDWARHLFAAAK